MKGTRVSHPQLGQGRIVRIVRNSQPLVLEVDFKYETLTVTIDELNEADALRNGIGAVMSSDKSHKADRPSQRKTRGKTRPADDQLSPPQGQGLMALRLGMILDTRVKQLTVGTESAQRVIAKTLEATEKGCVEHVLVKGEWGAGKTHLLAMLQAMGRERGFSTAAVVLDGVAATLSDPPRLVDQVLSELKGSRTEVSEQFSNLLQQAFEDGRNFSTQAGAFVIGKVLASLPGSSRENPDVWHTLEDFFSGCLSRTNAEKRLRADLNYRVELPAVHPRRMSDRPFAFAHLLGEMSKFIRATGRTGLIVVFDELDAEYAATFSTTQHNVGRRERRSQVLKELARLENAPLIVAYGAAPGMVMDLFEGKDDPVTHLREVFKEKLVVLDVPRLRAQDLKLLFLAIIDEYRKTYEDAFTPQRVTALKGFADKFGDYYTNTRALNPREFVRTSIELLDLVAENEGVGTADAFHDIAGMV